MKRLFVLFAVLSFSVFLYMTVASAAEAPAAPKAPAPPAPAQKARKGPAAIMMEDEMQIMEEAAENLPEKPIPPIKMIYVKGACFEMGDFVGDGDDDERPAHEICVSDYYLMDTEVTQELFEAVMGFNPIKPPDPKKPMMNITWHWANRFIRRLNERTRSFYRLPSEAEWEYAAREGGKKVKWSGTNELFDLKDYGWFSENSDFEVMPVAQRKPNALGFHDMSGNVWEWCDDNFDFDYYQKSPKNNPYGPNESVWKVIRGGSIADVPFKLRTTYRHALEPQLKNEATGFRLAK